MHGMLDRGPARHRHLRRPRARRRARMHPWRPRRAARELDLEAASRSAVRADRRAGARARPTARRLIRRGPQRRPAAYRPGSSTATTPAARCCTSTWTPSTPASRSGNNPELRRPAGGGRWQPPWCRRRRGPTKHASYGVLQRDVDEPGACASARARSSCRRTAGRTQDRLRRRSWRSCVTSRRWSSRSPWTRRSSTSPAAAAVARPSRRDRRAHPGAGYRRPVADSRVRSASRRPSSSPNLPPRAANRTACSWCPRARVLEFLHPLPVTALWGVGARTGESLHRLGIRSVGRSRGDTDRTPCVARSATAAAQHLAALAAGVDPRQVRAARGREVDQLRSHPRRRSH